MKINMGPADRIIRILIAIAIAVLYFTHTINGLPAYILIAVALIFTLTSLAGYCPLYSLAGIRTCRNRNA